jgi:hypothetical protein
MMEIVIAALAESLERLPPTEGETLIRSACETLAQTSPGLIAAMTLSLPAGGPGEANWLWAAACSLAAQYEFDAAVAADDSHVSVRLTRRPAHGGSR